MRRALRHRITGMIGVWLSCGIACAGTTTQPNGVQSPCSARGRASQPAGQRGPPPKLLEPSVFGPDFSWRQRVTVRYGERQPRSFDAVLQKQGDRMLLVGLTPINTVTFVVEQRGREVAFDNRTGQELPFDGRYILQDVQRVFAPWLSGPEVSGRRVGERFGERIEERLVDGRVVERTFRRGQQPPIRVQLKVGPVGTPAPQAILENPRFGYRLTIETTPGK